MGGRHERASCFGCSFVEEATGAGCVTRLASDLANRTWGDGYGHLRLAIFTCPWFLSSAVDAPRE
jgi:hypothetical protein